VWCDNRDWFPVEDQVLEFLPRDLQYTADRVKFQQRYIAELKAEGLLSRGAANADQRAADELNLVQAQQRHFDWYADNQEQAYDDYAAMPFWRVVDRRTFAVWNSQIRDAGHSSKLLLDVGCAQGRSARMVAQPGLHVIGFDISKRMVRQAYVNFGKDPELRAGGDFVVADASHFPFQTGVFDYALVYGVLHHLPDPQPACHEIARILKSRGIYFGSENNRTVFRKIFDVLQKISAAWHEEAGKQALMSSDDLNRWFSGTGLMIETSSIVFVPPHLVNILGSKVGGFVLAASDVILRAIPFFREQGGLLLVEGMKA
jgi:SAM-dependent methyltransferase